MTSMWVIRAGRQAEYFADFRDRKVAAMGWRQAGDMSKIKDRYDALALIRQTYPDYKLGKAVRSASNLFRFSKVIAQGDYLVTYNPSTRVYLVGEVTGAYRYDESVFSELMPNILPVNWKYEVPRDVLSLKTRQALGSISPLLEVPTASYEEILAHAKGEAEPAQHVEEEEQTEELYFLADIQERSKELIKDKINKLDLSAIKGVVTGLLRAMGYQINLNESSSKDIVASPAGFGFEQASIVVELKHQTQVVGAAEVKKFLEGRKPTDKLLFVCTAGFTKDAHTEASRSFIPLTLMDLDYLVDGLLEHYDRVDSETKELLPLVKVWWVG